MRKIALIAALIILTGYGPSLWAGEVLPWDLPSPKEMLSYKDTFNDPGPYYLNHDYWKKILPPDAVASITFDEAEMRREWEKTVGFKSPDVVGKIAPEIKPGKYSLEDKSKYPFDKLLPSYIYLQWGRPGENGTPMVVGNFTEFTLQPTRQYCWATPIARDTQKYAKDVKIADNGFIDIDSYVAGIPFPQPQEPHKGWKILWNFKLYSILIGAEDAVFPFVEYAFNDKLRQDHFGDGIWWQLKMAGRSVMPPLGRWRDKEAEKLKQQYLSYFSYTRPQSEYGNTYYMMAHMPHEKPNTNVMYYNAIRRIRKMSPSDGQDPFPGRDYLVDDEGGLGQKLSPTIYPYDVKVIEETEVIYPYTIEGRSWVDKDDDYLQKDLVFERRPVWILELTQLDSRYIYSKRYMVIDRENFKLLYTANYDQKGRLYRTGFLLYAFIPHMGIYDTFRYFYYDLIDVHSTLGRTMQIPAVGVDRNELSLRSLMRAVK